MKLDAMQRESFPDVERKSRSTALMQISNHLAYISVNCGKVAFVIAVVDVFPRSSSLASIATLAVKNCGCNLWPVPCNLFPVP